MIGVVFSCGMPFSPWQPAHSWICSLRRAGSWALAPWLMQRRSTPQRRLANRCFVKLGMSGWAEVARAKRIGARQSRAVSPLITLAYSRSIDKREGNQRIAAFVVELRVAAGRNDDELLTVDGIGGRRRIDTRARLELPQHGPGFRVVGLEQAIALPGESEATRRHQNAADHRLLGFHLPFDLAGVVIDRGDVAPLLLGGNDLEGAAEPELALGVGRRLDVVGHGLMQVDGIGQALARVDGNR